MERQITLTSKENKELEDYCKLNSLEPDKVMKNAYSKGIKIEIYGLLNYNQITEQVVEKIVEKEVIKHVEVIKEVEVPKIEYVEVIKEVEKIVEVPVEVVREVEKIIYNEGEVVEVIKEVEKIVEVPVEVIKEVIVEKDGDNEKMKMLEQTLQKLKGDNIEKDKKIKELEQTINNFQFNHNNQATYLRGSNLNNKLF
jgi:hypothetical protein